MAAGNPTLSDSYWLAQSPVFQNRVAVQLRSYCRTVDGETPAAGAGGAYVHQQRKQLVALVLNPANFPNWSLAFAGAAAADGNVIAAATQAATAYAPIATAAQGDTAAADGQSPNVTAVLIGNAIAAAFNSFVSGI